MAKRPVRRTAPTSIALAIREDQDGRSPREDNEPDERGKQSGIDPIVLEAREFWQDCQSAEAAMRESILAAKKFRSGNQWPEEIRIQRQGGGSVEGQAAKPPRPCLTIDRLSQPVRQVSNAIRTANFAIQVVPNGYGASQPIADIYEGIIRKIQVDSRDEAPVEWAAEGAIEAGLGWFRIKPVFCSDMCDTPGPEVFDQDLVLERVTNSLTVYCDPHAKKPTRSDARRMVVTEDVSRRDFRRRFKNANYASLEEFSATGDLAMWKTEKTVRIAEFWRIEDELVTIAQLPTGEFVTLDKMPDNVATLAKVRQIAKPRVRMYLINAVEVLEVFDWPGSHIPLIPILGEELNVDGEILLRGVIQEGMDAQRMVNYMYSAAVESVALAPKAPFIVAAGQVDNYKQFWQNANRDNQTYLPYDPVDLRGQPVPPPQRQTAEPPIQALVLMLQKSEEAINATTALWDASTTNAPVPVSGRGIRYLQQQSEMASSNFPDNVHRALVYAGEQLVEVIPKYYDRPGRVLHILGNDLSPQSVMIGTPPPQPQMPQGMPGSNGNGAQPMMAPQPSAEDAKLAEGMQKFFDPSAGRYAVTVEVGKGFATKRQESAMILGELISGLPPEIAAAVTPAFIRMMDFPNADEIADAAQRALPPQLQPPSAQPNPQQLQAQLAQAQQLLQQMKPLADKNQADLMKVQMQEQAESARSAAADDVQIKKAEIAATASMANAQAKVDAENFRSYVDALETRLAHSLNLHMAKTEKLHDMVTQLVEHHHEATQNAQDRAHEVTLQAMQPEPTTGDSGAGA